MKFSKPFYILLVASCAAIGLAPVQSMAQKTMAEKAAKQSAENAANPVRPTMVTKQADLKDVLAYSYQYNPSLRAARAELYSIKERVPQAFAGYLPTAQATGSVTSVDNSDSNFGSATGSTSKEMEVAFNQPLFRGGGTMAGMDRARSLVETQKALLNAQSQQILLEVATAYMDVLSNESLLILAENNKTVIGEQLNATEERFEVGELTRTDIAQAEARLAGAEAERVRALADLRAARAEFERLTGRAPQSLIEPQIEFNFPDNLEDAIGIALDNNYDVIAAKNTHKAAEQAVDENFAEHLPDVDIAGSWGRTYDPQPGLLEEQTTKTIGVTAVMPLYQAGAVRSKVRESKHVANQRYIEIVETKERVEQQVVAAWEELHMAGSEITSRESQIKASRIAREGVGYENELGVRTVLDVLDADQELLDAENSLVLAKRNKVVAQFTLAMMLGYLTPDRLGLEFDNH